MLGDWVDAARRWLRAAQPGWPGRSSARPRRPCAWPRADLHSAHQGLVPRPPRHRPAGALAGRPRPPPPARPGPMEGVTAFWRSAPEFQGPAQAPTTAGIDGARTDAASGETSRLDRPPCRPMPRGQGRPVARRGRGRPGRFEDGSWSGLKRSGGRPAQAVAAKSRRRPAAWSTGGPHAAEPSADPVGRVAGEFTCGLSEWQTGSGELPLPSPSPRPSHTPCAASGRVARHRPMELPHQNALELAPAWPPANGLLSGRADALQRDRAGQAVTSRSATRGQVAGRRRRRALVTSPRSTSGLHRLDRGRPGAPLGRARQKVRWSWVASRPTSCSTSRPRMAPTAPLRDLLPPGQVCTAGSRLGGPATTPGGASWSIASGSTVGPAATRPHRAR